MHFIQVEITKIDYLYILNNISYQNHYNNEGRNPLCSITTIRNSHSARLLLSSSLYGKVVKLTKVLWPISTALQRAQADATSLGDGYDIMNKLMADPVLAPYLGKLKKRRDQAILPCHMAAYMLHPKYVGQEMDQSDAETARMWLCNINPEFVAAAITFQSQGSPYPRSFFQPMVLYSMGPATCWRSLRKNCNLPKGFVDLVTNLHSTSASAACIERVFSTFGLVMTKLRNRLGIDKAQKLVFCYRMLRGPMEPDY